jgi:hypothetical protein
MNSAGRIEMPPEELLEVILQNIQKLADDGMSSDSKANYRFRTIKKRAGNALKVLHSFQDTSTFSIEEFSKTNSVIDDFPETNSLL